MAEDDLNNSKPRRPRQTQRTNTYSNNEGDVQGNYGSRNESNTERSTERATENFRPRSREATRYISDSISRSERNSYEHDDFEERPSRRNRRNTEKSSRNSNYSNSRKRKRNFKQIIITNCVLLLGVAGIFVGVLYGNVKGNITVEAGQSILPEDFLRFKIFDISTTTTNIDFNTPNEYTINLDYLFFNLDKIVIVEDTIPPEVVAKDGYCLTNGNLEPEKYISSAVDATALKYTVTNYIDTTVFTTQQVSIEVEDLGGNKTVVTANVTPVPVYSEIVVEAGEDLPKSSEFILSSYNGEYTCDTDISSIPNNEVGKFPVLFNLDGMAIESYINVIDTIPPSITPKDSVVGYFTQEFNGKEFAKEIEDKTSVSFEITSNIDLSNSNSQVVNVKAIDEGGNTFEFSSMLTLEDDVEPPFIQVPNVIYAAIGNGVAYKSNLVLSDNTGNEPELTIDNGGVNIQIEGIYPVTYTATDKAGNSTSKEVDVKIYNDTGTEGQIITMAQEVLSDIITDGMTLKEKAVAIFNWCHNKIGYDNFYNKEDYLSCAYDGLSKRSGDCFVYAYVSQVLLTEAGIPNVSIEKIPTATTKHIWNLVDVGDGWVHFDATRRMDKMQICLWDNSKLLDYSNKNSKSHNYDPNEYPYF